jgi:hypothetical protein
MTLKDIRQRAESEEQVPGSLQGYEANDAFNDAKISESRNDVEKAMLWDVGTGRKYNSQPTIITNDFMA